MLHWYSLYTRPRHEALVAGRLQAQGVEVFLPQYTQRAREKPPRTRPLFPCYLFAQLDLGAVGVPALRWTPGLRYIVSFGGAPAQVPDEAIALVRKRLAGVEACGGVQRPRFQPGEQVRIHSGPLAGLEAIFERPMGSGERVRVLIRFLGEVNRAVVPVEVLGAPLPCAPRRTRGHGRVIGR